jgi:benzoyl-CoA reductase/2-hydroxyglutaryl-CoA dehydratase subunit BcrC/BadD/HgdB
MKTALYSCPFVPSEWIAAHGWRPRRVAPSRPDLGAPAVGVCPYAWAFSEAACRDTEADAAIFTTTCDQMRRLSEQAAQTADIPVFLMHVPATWQTAGAQAYYRDELRRLGRFLVESGGRAPRDGDLAGAMRDYDDRRRELRDVGGRVSGRRFAEAIARFHREGVVDVDASETATDQTGVPLALIGSPLLAEHFKLFDLIEEAGGRVVLNATTNGERTLPKPFDRRAMRDDPLGALVDAYFGGIPDAFRRPNSQLYAWLERELAAREVRGIVFWQYLWCDTWRAEAQRMKEWAGLPFVALDSGDSPEVDGRVDSRVRALLETLQ